MRQPEQDDDGPDCKRCSTPMEWADCSGLGCEDGYYEAYEEDPLWYGDEDALEVCPMCNGEGGFWYCPANCHLEQQSA